MLGLHVGNNFRQLSCISVSSFGSGGLKCRRTKDISNFKSEFMFHAFTVRLCKVGFATAESKKKCFSIALRHTLVVLEMH